MAGHKLLWVLLICAACLCRPALACGFHDQSQLRRTVMNWVYPDSLHVATAVWRAQATGQLAPDELAAQGDVTPEARNVLGYLKVATLLGRFGKSLSATPLVEPRPGLAVVLLGPMLWSRFAVQGTELRVQVHLEGPEQGDVVLVTEAPVIEALVEGRLRSQEAARLGLIRLYGEAVESGAALDWLRASLPGRTETIEPGRSCEPAKPSACAASPTATERAAMTTDSAARAGGRAASF